MRKGLRAGFLPSWTRAQRVRHRTTASMLCIDTLPWERDSLAIDPALSLCACRLGSCNRGSDDTRHIAERKEATKPPWPRTTCVPTASSNALDWKPSPYRAPVLHPTDCSVVFFCGHPASSDGCACVQDWVREAAHAPWHHPPRCARMPWPLAWGAGRCLGPPKERAAFLGGQRW